MALKSGNDVQVGDTLIVGFNGGIAQVKALRPYQGILLELMGEGTKIASFHGAPAEMTLCAKSVFNIA
ncbi:hypothetical protein [Paraburkholderia domus]|uniref:hypothetical protein n=1 Tax=Paraburkholderia domus TaxID=2793075 RepID=UPI0019115B4D|nr:hypothetical protein [Paraburkholderia domus]MBK5061761.1 hypothetical protein [Burkholderia sp. R-70199]CAE6899929.1 hypothetical protein R70199_03634 [Paraburkholderia domus]